MWPSRTLRRPPRPSAGAAAPQPRRRPRRASGATHSRPHRLGRRFPRRCGPHRARGRSGSPRFGGGTYGCAPLARRHGRATHDATGVVEQMHPQPADPTGIHAKSCGHSGKPAVRQRADFSPRSAADPRTGRDGLAGAHRGAERGCWEKRARASASRAGQIRRGDNHHRAAASHRRPTRQTGSQPPAATLRGGRAHLYGNVHGNHADGIGQCDDAEYARSKPRLGHWPCRRVDASTTSPYARGRSWRPWSGVNMSANGRPGTAGSAASRGLAPTPRADCETSSGRFRRLSASTCRLRWSTLPPISRLKVPNHRPTSTSAFSCGSHSRWGARADDSAGLGGQRGRAHLDHSPALSRGETSSREHASWCWREWPPRAGLAGGLRSGGIRTGFGGRRCRTIVRGAACPGETLVAPGPTSLALEASGRRPGDWITGRRPCRPIKLGLLSAAVIAYRHEPVRTT